MAFTDAELARIKAELGYNLLQAGADYYIGITAVFEQVVNVYIAEEVATTSSTSVTAASTPTPVALTLASATGFAARDRVFIDVDARLEHVTIQSLAGTSATVLLSLAHAGTYPVVLEGPISLAKEALRRIDAVKLQLGGIFGEGALKKVDEIEFYNSGGSLFESTGVALMRWRDELASILGVPNLWRRRSGSQGLSVY